MRDQNLSDDFRPAAALEADLHALDLFSLKAAGIKVVQEEALADYCEKFPEVQSAIQAVAPHLLQEFGNNSQVVLSFFRSQEDDTKYPVFYIRQHDYEPFLMRRVRAFRDKHRDLYSTANGFLHITSDFQQTGQCLIGDGSPGPRPPRKPR